jgi:cytochrome c biogenesis protein CcmG/thiol:disulfide interchange protein DsbE
MTLSPAVLRRGLVTLSLLGALLLVLALGFGQDPHAVPSVRVNLPGPDFALSSLDGNQISLVGLRGRPTLINFWSTWCYPCQAETPLLNEAARRLAPHVHFLGVVYQDSEDAMRAALRSRPMAYPQLLDPGSQMAMDYGVAGVPETFVLDPNGTVIYKHAGPLTYPVLHEVLGPYVPAGVWGGA